MTNTEERVEDTYPLAYQCRLPLSTRTVNHPADLLRRRLKAIRSRWRTLPPGKIAVIVLAVLRHDSGWPTWPARATCLLRALLVLTNPEINR